MKVVDSVKPAAKATDPKLSTYLLRGVLNFGIPVTLFSVTMVFLTDAPHGWRDLLSLKYVLTLLYGVLPVGIVTGLLYGWTMWAIFTKSQR